VNSVYVAKWKECEFKLSLHI